MSLRFCPFRQQQNGTLELIDNVLFYTPDQDFDGSDSFEYEILSNNGSLVGIPGKVTIDVRQSHQQPQTQINPAVAPELTPSGRFLEVKRLAKLPLDAEGRQPRMNSFATAGDRSFVVTDGSIDGRGEIFELVTDIDGETTAELFFDAASAIFDNTGLAVNNLIPLFGLRSVAFHPEFATNGKFYIAYTGDRPCRHVGVDLSKRSPQIRFPSTTFWQNGPSRSKRAQ